MKTKYLLFLALISISECLYSAQINNQSDFTLRLIIRRENDCSKVPYESACTHQGFEEKTILPHTTFSLAIPKKDYYKSISDAYIYRIDMAALDKNGGEAAANRLEDPIDKQYVITVTDPQSVGAYIVKINGVE